MTSLERQEKLISYGMAPFALAEALRKYPEDMWTFKPGPKKWSIHQVIIHLADSEANSFVRCRRAIAEPGSGVYGYDQDAWADTCDYHNQSTEDALELFRLLRKMSYMLIKDLPEHIWNNTIDHSENGIMTLDDWLISYEKHVPQHLGQMERTYEEWKMKNG